MLVDFRWSDTNRLSSNSIDILEFILGILAKLVGLLKRIDSPFGHSHPFGSKVGFEVILLVECRIGIAHTIDIIWEFFIINKFLISTLYCSELRIVRHS